MIIQNQKSKRIRLLLLLIAFALSCIISFALGVLLLKNGTLRKWYDGAEAILSYNQKIDVENYERLAKIDTIHLKLSKKNFNRISLLRNKVFFDLKNLVNYHFQWKDERQWIKSKIIFRNTSFDGRIKLIGLNADHYREGINWSTRVKLKSNHYIYGFSKFNLLNPYSRGYFADLYYNEINRNVGGLYIPSKPVITHLGSQKILQIFEPFFSKELLEFNHHKDFIIMNEDSTDKIGKHHLRLVHPNSSKLSLEQRRIYAFYEKQFQKKSLANYVNKTDLILQYSIGINTGNNFHHMGFNTYYYADPMIGELRTFIREIDVAGSKSINLEESIEKLKINRPDSTELKFKIYTKTKSINSLKFNTVLNNSNELINLYFQSQRLIPRSHIYAKKINNQLTNSKKEFKFPAVQKKHLTYLSSLTLKNKTLIYCDNDSILISSNSKIKLINAQIIFKGYLKNHNKLSFELDGNSSIIFERCNVNLSNTSFKGGGTNLGNIIQNRQVSSPYNFAECTVLLTNCIFLKNISGDDLVNFYRSDLLLNGVEVLNAKYDGLDFDWCTGRINNCKISNCGNDGLDFAGSKIKILNTAITKCGDKAISIGEKSRIEVTCIELNKNEIGIAVKDESKINISSINATNNSIDIVAYNKKAQYGISEIIDSSGLLSKLSYLIENDVLIESPVKIIKRINEIKKMMYGHKFGKASVR
ncbi:MAG: hypothetical protein RLY43_1394 [Bacteroidota bacterium]|jgi:hypothetical protein